MDTETKIFKCDNGRSYRLPANHCLFCDNCTHILYDYMHGPYAWICDLDEKDYRTCGKFKEEVEDMARCKDCIHSGVCAELEKYRDPLWFTNTKDEFCCSSYLHADVAPRAKVAREIIEEIDGWFWYCESYGGNVIKQRLAELKKKYAEDKI